MQIEMQKVFEEYCSIFIDVVLSLDRGELLKRGVWATAGGRGLGGLYPLAAARLGSAVMIVTLVFC